MLTGANAALQGTPGEGFYNHMGGGSHSKVFSK